MSSHIRRVGGRLAHVRVISLLVLCFLSAGSVASPRQSPAASSASMKCTNGRPVIGEGTTSHTVELPRYPRVVGTDQGETAIDLALVLADHNAVADIAASMEFLDSSYGIYHIELQNVAGEEILSPADDENGPYTTTALGQPECTLFSVVVVNDEDVVRHGRAEITLEVTDPRPDPQAYDGQACTGHPSLGVGETITVAAEPAPGYDTYEAGTVTVDLSGYEGPSTRVRVWARIDGSPMAAGVRLRANGYGPSFLESYLEPPASMDDTMVFAGRVGHCQGVDLELLGAATGGSVNILVAASDDRSS